MDIKNSNNVTTYKNHHTIGVETVNPFGEIKMLTRADNGEHLDGMRKSSGSLRQRCWMMGTGNAFGESSGLQSLPETNEPSCTKRTSSIFRFIHGIKRYSLKALSLRKWRKEGGDCGENNQQQISVAGTSDGTRQAKSCGYIESKLKLRKRKEQLGKSESEPLKGATIPETVVSRSKRQKTKSLLIYCCFAKKKKVDDGVIEICLCPQESKGSVKTKKPPKEKKSKVRIAKEKPSSKKSKSTCCVCGGKKKSKTRVEKKKSVGVNDSVIEICLCPQESKGSVRKEKPPKEKKSKSKCSFCGGKKKSKTRVEKKRSVGVNDSVIEICLCPQESKRSVRKEKPPKEKKSKSKCFLCGGKKKSKTGVERKKSVGLNDSVIEICVCPHGSKGTSKSTCSICGGKKRPKKVVEKKKSVEVHDNVIDITCPHESRGSVQKGQPPNKKRSKESITKVKKSKSQCSICSGEQKSEKGLEKKKSVEMHDSWIEIRLCNRESMGSVQQEKPPKEKKSKDSVAKRKPSPKKSKSKCCTCGGKKKSGEVQDSMIEICLCRQESKQKSKSICSFCWGKKKKEKPPPKVKKPPKQKPPKKKANDEPKKSKNCFWFCKKKKTSKSNSYACKCGEKSKTKIAPTKKKSSTKNATKTKSSTKSAVSGKKKSSLFCCKKGKSEDLQSKRGYQYDIALPEAMQNEGGAFNIIATLLRQIYQEINNPPFKGSASAATIDDMELMRTDNLGEEYQTTVYAIRRKTQASRKCLTTKSSNQQGHSVLTIYSGPMRMQVKADKPTNWFAGTIGNLEITINEKSTTGISVKSSNTDPLEHRSCAHCFSGAYDTYSQTNDSYLTKNPPTQTLHPTESKRSIKSKSSTTSMKKMKSTNPILKRFAAVDVYKKLVGVDAMTDDDPRKYIVKIQFNPRDGCCAKKCLSSKKSSKQFQECGCNWTGSLKSVSLRDMCVVAEEPPKQKASKTTQATKRRKSPAQRKNSVGAQTCNNNKKSRLPVAKHSGCPAKDNCPHLRKQNSRSTFPTNRCSSRNLFKRSIAISKITCPHAVSSHAKNSGKMPPAEAPPQMSCTNLKTSPSLGNQIKKVKVCAPLTDKEIQVTLKHNLKVQHPEMLEEKTQTQRKKQKKSSSPQYCFE